MRSLQESELWRKLFPDPSFQAHPKSLPSTMHESWVMVRVAGRGFI